MCLERECWANFDTLRFRGKNGWNNDGITSAFSDINTALFDFYIIGTHSNNVLIWFTKRILGTVFLCPYNVCPK